MLKIYHHKNNGKFYYCVYSGTVNSQQIHDNYSYFNKYIQKFSPVIYITEHKADAVLGDNQVLKLMSEYADSYAEHFEVSYMLGIYGIRKLFLKTFMAFSKSQIKRKVLNSKEELEKIYQMNLDNDFELGLASDGTYK